MRKTIKKIGVIALATMMTVSFATGCKKKTSEGFDKNTAISVITREEGSGTRGAFIELFGIEEKNAEGQKVDNTTSKASVNNSTSTVLVTVAGNKYAIGYVSLGSLNNTVKALKIDGAQATTENINNGTYKISRPFNIATKGTVSDVTTDFINYIMSAEGQKIVEDAGYIKVSDKAEFTSNGATGTIKIEGSTSVTPVMEKLAEAYQKVNTGAKIEINPNDSSTGMSAVADGLCDIGMASRDAKDSELEKGVEPLVIAMDGIAVIVNKECEADGLTAEQVKSIYTGNAEKWSDVIGK